MYKTLRGCMSAEVKVKLATTLLVFIVFRVFQAKVHRPIREFCAHVDKNCLLRCVCLSSTPRHSYAACHIRNQLVH